MRTLARRTVLLSMLAMLFGAVLAQGALASSSGSWHGGQGGYACGGCGRAPDAPTAVSAVGSSVVGGSATISWAAPGYDGGMPITGYTVTADPGGLSCVTTGDTTCTVSGLTNGASYMFTVTATNSHGTGSPSASSQCVVISVAPGAPGAPTDISAASGAGQATVSWAAPADDGGAPITAYVATASPGGATCATAGETTCVITGLQNGIAYTFTVAAANSIARGDPSPVSAPVTPLPVPAPTPTPQPVAAPPEATPQPVAAPLAAPPDPGSPRNPSSRKHRRATRGAAKRDAGRGPAKYVATGPMLPSGDVLRDR